ncbi:unnamed protein product, partial [Ectocarpus sp. 13 AM-2016]
MYLNTRDRRSIGWTSAGGSVEGVGSISAKANRDEIVSIHSSFANSLSLSLPLSLSLSLSLCLSVSLSLPLCL